MNRIVSTVYFEGDVYIFLENGTIYKMWKRGSTGEINFQLMARLDLNR